MSDLSNMTDEDLMRVANLSERSDEELMAIAGLKTKVEPTESIFKRAINSLTQQGAQMLIPQENKGLTRFAGPAGLPWQKPVNDSGGMMDVMGGAPGETVSDAADIKNPLARGIIGAGLDPRTYVGLGKGAEMAGSEAVQGAKKTGSWFAKPWQEVSKIDNFKSQGMSDIAQEAVQKEAQINKSGALKKQVVENLYGKEPMDSLQTETNYLEKSIPKATNKEALRLQEEIPVKFRQKSAEFGSELKKLIGDKPVLVESQKVKPAIENALLEHGVLRFNELGDVIPARVPMNPQETKLVDLYTKLKSQMLDGNEYFDAADILKTDDALKVPFGKAFTKSDMLMANVKKNLSGVIEDQVPGLRELRANHAPFMKGKYAAIKELNPFSNEYNTGKASKFLEKYSKNSLDPDDKRLVGFLENELGRPIASESRAFGNRLQQSASRKSSIESNLKQILSDVDRTIEDSLTAVKTQRIESEKQLQDVVDQMIRKNNWDKWKRYGASVAIGTVLKNTVVNKVLNLLKSRPTDA